MRKLFPFLFSLLLSTVLYAQKDLPPGMFMVNPLHDTADVLPKIMYKYPAFKAGQAVFTTGASVPARFNYNLLLSELQFITPAGDTLVLNNPERYRYIIVDADTIYFTPKGTFWQVQKEGEITLVKREVLQYRGSEKRGAFDNYSPGASIAAVNMLSNKDNVMAQLKVDENLYYMYDSSYFLMDKYHKVEPATRKSFYDVFDRKEKILRQYLQTHPVNFRREMDLVELLRFLKEQ